MQFYLYKDIQQRIHASVDQKKIGCRIRINSGLIQQTGVTEFIDLIDFLDTVTCQDCQNRFSKKVLSEDNEKRRNLKKSIQPAMLSEKSFSYTEDAFHQSKEDFTLQGISYTADAFRKQK